MKDSEIFWSAGFFRVPPQLASIKCDSLDAVYLDGSYPLWGYSTFASIVTVCEILCMALGELSSRSSEGFVSSTFIIMMYLYK